MAKAVLRGNVEADVMKKDDRAIISIIKKGIALQSRLEKIRQDIEGNIQRLLPFAEELAGTTGLKQAAFKSADGKVDVKFNDSVCYEEKAMGTIREILGPLFGSFFTCTMSYSLNVEDIPAVKRKLGKKYARLIRETPVHKHTKRLRDLMSDGDDPVVKELRNFVGIEVKKPTVKFERFA